MPCEVGSAAFLSTLENVVCYGDTIDSAKKEGSIAKFLTPIPKNVFLLGTYWNSDLDKTSKLFPDTEFYLYSFGEGTDSKDDNVNKTYGVKNVSHGPAWASIEFVRQVGLSSKLFEMAVRLHRPILDMIDDRILNRNIVQNQILYSGLYNYPKFAQDQTLFQKFVSVFCGEVDIDAIMEVGKVVLDCQLGMARERAVKNSKIIVLSDGTTKASVTDAPDLINLTHDALHGAHKTSVTICTSWKFGTDKPDQLALSVRSFDPQINAERLIQAFDKNGGGNSSAAGGRIVYLCPINI
jgi:hypothetical protein